ncbi:MAG: hypothetical protein J0I12_26320 [Candidatus Eremiobacteraeota bacterium]|nr:hypothetical protein [Candidatus Eremiobacteraeota bacterium]
MSEWRWKDPAQGALLRYEPGNWGDILKGEWLCLWLEWKAAAGARGLRYQDPFCGWSEYPVTEATRGRVTASPATRYANYLGLSSASLVSRHAESLGLRVESRLSDRETALELLPCDLLLFDPYDFFERWPDWNDLLLEASRDRDVVVYLYNKSPRGASPFRQYQSLRERWKGRPLVMGRVAADAVLPRAWHEVWLVGPSAQDPTLRMRLQEATLALHRHVSDGGAFEC